MSNGQPHEYLVLGAGPAGLQLSYHFARAGVDYLILESADRPGNFFKEFPRHRKLISINKVYTGYDDDIVQRIEAGNVFLQSPSELIRGGQRLFGLRTDLRFGPVSVTAVASQQDAESSELVLEGGSQTTNFSLAPYDYEDNTHFYLAYLFYNWWDEGHADPNVIAAPPGFDSVIAATGARALMLGLENESKLLGYGVDPLGTRCEFSRKELERIRHAVE